MDSLAHLMLNNVTNLHRLSLFSESFLKLGLGKRTNSAKFVPKSSYVSTESAKF